MKMVIDFLNPNINSNLMQICPCNIQISKRDCDSDSMKLMQSKQTTWRLRKERQFGAVLMCLATNARLCLNHSAKHKRITWTTTTTREVTWNAVTWNFAKTTWLKSTWLTIKNPRCTRKIHHFPCFNVYSDSLRNWLFLDASYVM